MKNFCLTLAVVVFLLVCSSGIQAQTTQTKLNQIELMKQHIGTSQATIGKDTVEVWENQQYGKAFIITVYQVIKGQKTPLYINNLGFDAKEDKFKGYVLWVDGTFNTWIGSYTTDKKFSVDFVQNFNPETVTLKGEYVYVSPKESTWTQFNTAGVKILEYKFDKVK